MSFYVKLFCSVSFVLFCFVIQVVSAGSNSNVYVYHLCSSPMRFAGHNIFERNVKHLTQYLSSTTSEAGFNFGSFREGAVQVYGHALCRGDISSKECKACVRKASNVIRSQCPNSRNAIIWYEKCLFKYSSTDFFGRIDSENMFVILSPVHYASDLQMYHEKIINLLGELANDASTNSERYAVGNFVLGRSRKVFGMAQCTPDLLNKDCEKCLRMSIAMLPKWFETTLGAHIISGSCILRYESSKFVKMI